MGAEMKDALQNILDQAAGGIARRTSIFDVRLEELSGEAASFSGRVLQKSQLESLRKKIEQAFPQLEIDTSQVRVLEEGASRFHVNTNLTGLYEKPSFGVPLASELYYGMELMALEEHERWAYVQQQDGYLGWAYKPYLKEGNAPAATHLVLAPSLEVWDDPEMHGNILTRLVSGTGEIGRAS